jgi:hypothetical protein
MSYNLKQSGSTARQCDPGLPITGRSADTGQYNIARINPDGSMGTMGAAGGISLPTPSAITVSIGAIVANRFLGTIAASASGSAFLEGMYRVNPTAFWQGTGGGSLSFILYKLGTTFDTYVGSVGVGNPFTPSVTDISTGVAGYWHAVAGQAIGLQSFAAYNRSNALDLYLEAGSYNLMVFTDTNITTTLSPMLVGFYSFARL